MIPRVAVVRANAGRRIGLLVPLFLFWLVIVSLLLILLLLLALPFLVLFAPVAPVRTWRGARGFFSLLNAVRGFRVETSTPVRSSLVHIP